VSDVGSPVLRISAKGFARHARNRGAKVPDAEHPLVELTRNAPVTKRPRGVKDGAAWARGAAGAGNDVAVVFRTPNVSLELDGRIRFEASIEGSQIGERRRVPGRPIWPPETVGCAVEIE